MIASGGIAGGATALEDKVGSAQPVPFLESDLFSPIFRLYKHVDTIIKPRTVTYGSVKMLNRVASRFLL